ncbi:hypothetical protein [Limnoglobus roseus]|uniref:Uncharacterized protein n=1 Tax=Limnoglobus roseus TaxID=2598579 RepID=A0A5C1AQ27_9BACT|nr:hypothetical protein [Limnoglobus roseus]QEL18968.1 hypothetical protein PX52LOC_06018 [Limnoglobus roseus]
MNTTDPAPDDSHWSSLAHELGLDSETPPAAPEPQPTPVEISHHHASHHHADLPDAADEEDTMLEPVLSAEPVAEPAEGEEGTGDEQTDEGGKRRRRRRRRRRKGGPEVAGATPAEGGEEPAEEGFAEEEEPATVASTGETPSHDAMRDVVANWNVPSWDELIGGLYRPGN